MNEKYFIMGPPFILLFEYCMDIMDIIIILIELGDRTLRVDGLGLI